MDPQGISVVPTPGRPAYLPATASSGDLNDEMLASDFWSDDLLVSSGIPVVDVPFVTVGGGIGSFVMVDYLRIAGVPPEHIRVLSALDYPWQTYEHLTRVSQIPRGERLRSDSASRPDNIWGFPSYAVSEFVATKRLKPLLQVLVEPILDDYWTPEAGQVFRALERESKRIQYQQMLNKGLVRIVRRRTGSGYFTVFTPPEGVASTKRIAFRSQFVHLAVGYPGLRFLPDLQAYRTQHSEYHRIVNAYESHEHVYTRLLQQPSTVMVRGSGIVASRILQRLMDDRLKHDARTQIVHLFRTFIDGPNDGLGNPNPALVMRRRGGHGWAYQGFNYPKSVWGGQLKQRMRGLEGEERAKLYKVIGGTNTPHRRYWQKQLKVGRSQGWYQPIVGTVEKMEPAHNQIVSHVNSPTGPAAIAADFIIDCTGLEAEISEHRLLNDLLEHGGAGRNPIGRLDVERTFELRGCASGSGAIYASGATTLGGYFPGVDTFLGLQIAAQEIADDLARRGFCKRIGPLRSTTEWFKWLRGKDV